MMTQDASRHISPQFTQPFTFVPVDLNNDKEVRTLLRQRDICGWSNEMEDIERWRDQIARDVKWMWWITLPPTQTPSDSKTDKDKDDYDNDGNLKIGHVALAAECHPPDLELANPDHSTLTVSSFFLLPQYRAIGLGRACFMETEEKARRISNCHTIAIDTIDRRYTFDEDPEWQGLLNQAGKGSKKGKIVTEDWYARMGYVKFKAEPRYPSGRRGDDKKIVAVFMRKKIR